MTQASPLKDSTISLYKGDRVELGPVMAWHEGTNIRTSLKHAPLETRAWLVMEVGKLCRDIDANKTLETDEEFAFTCRAILDEFPAMKAEEIRVAFDMIRMGKLVKLYERLKTAEILEALRQYEGEVRAPILEDYKKEEFPEGPLAPLGLGELAKTLTTVERTHYGSGRRVKDFWDEKFPGWRESNSEQSL